MEQQPTEYTLTPDEVGMIQPIIETVENLQRDAQAVLRAITRLRKLDGQWNLVGNKLVQVAAPPAQAPIMPLPEAEKPRELVNGKG